MRQIIVRRCAKKYAGQNTWEYEIDGELLVQPFLDKWEAYDNAREQHPQAMIKIEGIGIINGGSTATREDDAREVGGISREATSTA